MTEKNSNEYMILLEADNAKHKTSSRNSELAKKIIIMALGISCWGISLAIFVFSSKGMGGVFTSMIFGTLFLIGGSICFANLFWDSLAPIIVDGIFNPGGKFKAPPEQLSPIKGLIVEGKNEEAIENLNAILERQPFAPKPYLMLIELYLEQTGQQQKIVDMIQKYFTNLSRHNVKRKQNKLSVIPENIELLMIYSDTCQELGLIQSAIELLAHEAECKDYSVPDQKAIIKRLNKQRSQKP